ncbi:MAG: response regulator [Pseudomonadota bacterium]
MNTDMLLALGLALVVGAAVVLALLRRGRRPAAPERPAARPAQAAPAADAPLRPSPELAQIDAQRQLATEALRQARQRKADEAARLEAERAGHARSEAAARAALRPAAPLAPPAAPAPRPVLPVAAQPQRPVAPPSVPTQPPLLSPRAISSATPQPAAAAPGLAPLRGTPPQRVPLVLLADDSKVVRIKTGRLLEKQGWQVLLAEDGAAALQALDAHAPDLLITDVEMPGLDGFELTRRVRAHARFARLPVIMITSSDERHRAEANAAGVNLLLGKPYAEETLLAQVQVMLAAAAQRAAAGLALH